VASIASLAGATFFNPDDCAASSPVHVLEIHGTNDTTISYFGGIIFDALYPSATQTVEQWAIF
jgi:polyhydroxybutyrate depolymerase